MESALRNSHLQHQQAAATATVSVKAQQTCCTETDLRCLQHERQFAAGAIRPASTELKIAGFRLAAVGGRFISPEF